VTSFLPRGQSWLQPRLEAALLRAGSTHDWVRDVVPRLCDGRAQWHSTPDGRGCIVTELLDYPNYKVVNYWLAAGELHACRSLVPGIEDWARGEHCVRAIGLGRPGFRRVLGDDVDVVGLAFSKNLMGARDV
jgi:hypothetical protein